MKIFILLGLLAGVITIVVYIFYIKQLLKSQSTPNPSSWAIWLIAGLINTFTYFSVTKNNLSQSLIVIAVLLSTFIIFLYAFWKGRFTKISQTEITVFVLAVLVGVFWKTTSNDRIANLLLQFIYLISYTPTINGILKGHAKENPTSWTIILVAYIFSFFSILLGPHSDWVIFLNPLINGLLGTGLVIFAIYHKNHGRSL